MEGYREHCKIVITSNDPEKLKKIIDYWNTLNNTNNQEGQQTLPEKQNNNKNRKYFCNNRDCKKEIDKHVVVFCLHSDNKERFKGKVFCRECQETHQ